MIAKHALVGVPLVCMVWLAASCDSNEWADLDKSCAGDADCKLVASCCMCGAVNVSEELPDCDSQCVAAPCSGEYGESSPMPYCNAGTCALRPTCPDGDPSYVPTAGRNCGPEAMTCSYGDELRPGCRLSTTCDPSEGWSEPAQSGCTAHDVVNCPATTPGHGSECSAVPLDTLCEYESESTVCRCLSMECLTACQVFDPPEWRCAAPGGEPGCPTAVPNAGDPCSESGLSCEYFDGPCSGIGVITECTEGAWHWLTTIPCPL